MFKNIYYRLIYRLIRRIFKWTLALVGGLTGTGVELGTLPFLESSNKPTGP